MIKATALSFFIAANAQAFCGFYVAKGDAKIFNRASQVALVRDGDRTVMTMANDFDGESKEFAVVIPVPTFLKREQIHVGEKALVDHLRGGASRQPAAQGLAGGAVLSAALAERRATPPK